MSDLFAIAAANGTAINEAFELLVAGLSGEHSTIAREFAAWVEANASISMNTRLYVVVELLNGRMMQNIYEWAEEQERMSGRRADEALRERLQGFYDRRLTFDGAFSGGTRFRYAAINAGTVGLPRYAPYCVVLTKTFETGVSDIAYWPGDSLKVFFTIDGLLDFASLVRQVSPRGQRHLMVAKERANEALVHEKADWPSLVAAEDNYFEAAFVGAVALASVECVRVLRAEHDRLWDLAFANFGRKLTDAERALVSDYVQLQRGFKEGRICLEVIG
jgi:hypothetical protein